jgi:hypothetical protein
MHAIEAIVAKAPINDEIAKEYDLSVFLHAGYAIIALDEDHAAFWAEKLKLESETRADNGLDRPIIRFFARELGLNRYAVIVTAYAGGIGTQYAAVYEDERALMPETEGGINAALRLIGVEAAGKNDEFDTISLGRYRSFHRYYEEYWRDK